MSKTVRGTKRHCRNCGAKFYDLGRAPIECPICHAAYESQAQSQTQTPRPAPVAKAEPVEEVAAVASGPEIISLEDADAESGAEVAADEEEDIPDLGDVQEELPESGSEDVFLEEEEEDGSDVSGFIGGQIEPDEER